MNRISSAAYLRASQGQPCTLRIAGVCTGGGEDTVPAHIRDRHQGRSIKASDTSIADACFACHAKFDGRSGAPLNEEDWLFYALRGLQETIENRIERGILKLPEVPTRVKEITVTELRGSRLIHHAGLPLAKKPGRKPIPSRPLQGRPFQSKERAT